MSPPINAAGVTLSRNIPELDLDTPQKGTPNPVDEQLSRFLVKELLHSEILNAIMDTYREMDSSSSEDYDPLQPPSVGSSEADREAAIQTALDEYKKR